MDPGEVPAELRGLTQVEEMLITRAAPIMEIYCLDGDQRGDHVSNVAQDVAKPPTKDFMPVRRCSRPRRAS